MARSVYLNANRIICFRYNFSLRIIVIECINLRKTTVPGMTCVFGFSIIPYTNFKRRSLFVNLINSFFILYHLLCVD